MNPQFASLVLGLAQQAASLLEGKRPEGMPEGGSVKEVAPALIDTLSMLEEKMKGNLDQDESRLLTETLTTLRFQFLRVDP
jgi:hypothetical protein